MEVVPESFPEMELIFLSYAVVRMAKMKSHDLKGIQFHNQRERESKTNPDIDKERSHENYDLVNEKNIDYNKRVKEIIESQKTSTRKTRKDAVLVNELMITSDREFFDRLDPEEQKRFFEESYSLLAERYGEQNIAYAVVHNDEKTPHMHLGVVPMREGRLQSKNVFNRQELLWLQDNFPKHMQEQGFDLERGEKGSTREHIETREFKKQTLEKEIDSLEKNLNEVNKVCKKLGIQNTGTHAFRHTYARNRVDQLMTKEEKDLFQKCISRYVENKPFDYGVKNRRLYNSMKSKMDQIHGELGHGKNRFDLAVRYMR